MFGEYVPESDTKYYFYDQTRDSIEAYNLLDIDKSNLFGNKIGDLIETPRIVNATDILVKWIQYSKSIFVVGPPASGKGWIHFISKLFVKMFNYNISITLIMFFRKIILKCTNILRGIECVTIHCSAQTSPEQVLIKMSQVLF